MCRIPEGGGVKLKIKKIQIIISHIMYGHSYVLLIMLWNGLGKATEWEAVIGWMCFRYA